MKNSEISNAKKDYRIGELSKKKLNKLKNIIPFLLEYLHCKNGKNQRKSHKSGIFHYDNNQVPPYSYQTLYRK